MSEPCRVITTIDFDAAGKQFGVESPARAPATYRAERSGLLIGRRWPGPTRPGDCLAVIATEREPR
jgi:predicted deacylase